MAHDKTIRRTKSPPRKKQSERSVGFTSGQPCNLISIVILFIITFSRKISLFYFNITYVTFAP